MILHILNVALNITLQPSGLDQKTVGQRQDVICSISLPSNVDPDTIEFGWLNEDDIITNDSRVTIVRSSNDLISSDFSIMVFVTIVKFNSLVEDDEGNYTCYSTVNGTEISRSIQLQTTSKL